MQKSILYIAVVITTVFGCKSENSMDNKPSKFIEPGKFIQIVYDINVLEGGLENFNMNQFEFKDTAMQLYKGLFEKYDLTYETFKNNQDYYILTDKYKDITQRAADSASYELEKLKDITPIKMMSFIQFSQLLEVDDFKNFMEYNTILNYQEKLDSLLSFYRNNTSELDKITMDSISFEVNIGKMRKSSNPFIKVKEVFKSKKNE